MAVAEKGLDRRDFIRELTRSAHGKLEDYLPVGRRAAAEDPEFYAHLIAWNELKGAVRDAKVALPVIALGVPGLAEDFTENALAHMAAQSPRELLKGLRFGRTLVRTHGRAVWRVVERYLRVREENWGWWERTALQHKAVLKELYALSHVKPHATAQLILFDNKAPAGTVFDLVKRLKDLPVQEAATAILDRNIPFLIAQGALGKRFKEPDLLLALLERMTANEAINNAKMLERAGVKSTPALRGAFEAAMKRASGSKKATFKTDKAIAAVSDEGTKEKLRAVQEKQIQAIGVEGNWLVLGDKSGSMSQAIEASRLIAATLASVVKGEVELVFFDTMPRSLTVTGKDYAQILGETRHVMANGGTSIGCGLKAVLDKGLDFDGIAIVSDAAENSTPFFADVYERYCEAVGKEVPVYLYQLNGERTDALQNSMRLHGQDLQVFDLRGAQVDWVSLPNLVQTMRASRYSLVDEVMAAPLLTLAEVLKPRRAA